MLLLGKDNKRWICTNEYNFKYYRPKMNIQKKPHTLIINQWQNSMNVQDQNLS